MRPGDGQGEQEVPGEGAVEGAVCAGEEGERAGEAEEGAVGGEEERCWEGEEGKEIAVIVTWKRYPNTCSEINIKQHRNKMCHAALHPPD